MSLDRAIVAGRAPFAQRLLASPELGHEGRHRRVIGDGLRTRRVEAASEDGHA
jgi:hypothetical protein